MEYNFSEFQAWVDNMFGYEVDLNSLTEDEYYELEDIYRKENNG